MEKREMQHECLNLFTINNSFDSDFMKIAYSDSEQGCKPEVEKSVAEFEKAIFEYKCFKFV